MTTRPVTVLFCEHNVDGTIGGSYYSLLYLIQGLDRVRYRPIVVFYTDHALIPAYQQAGAETLVWPRPASPKFAATLPRSLDWLRPLALSAQTAFKFLRGFLLPALYRTWFLWRRDIALVHLNNSVRYNHDWMLAARLTGTRCITHERGINERFPAAAHYFGRRLGAIICISEAVRLNMIERGADFGNLQTIHNGLDASVLQCRTPPAELRARFAIAPDAPVVGMIGNIKAWKGQEIVVRAIARVRNEIPSVRCVVVGDTAPGDLAFEQSLRALVKEKGLDEHVLFAGYQKDVADFLTMFDVVVHASVLPEPFGRVVLEAMACRRPVIGSRDGGITEIIEHGRTGLTFPTRDDAALADAILRLLRNPGEAREMAERGYERLLRNFDIASNVTATQRLYERLLEV
jgi:glycosyltransferase involved in cell wall biosynthesis